MVRPYNLKSHKKLPAICLNTAVGSEKLWQKYVVHGLTGSYKDLDLKAILFCRYCHKELHNHAAKQDARAELVISIKTPPGCIRERQGKKEPRKT